MTGEAATSAGMFEGSSCSRLDEPFSYLAELLGNGRVGITLVIA